MWRVWQLRNSRIIVFLLLYYYESDSAIRRRPVGVSPWNCSRRRRVPFAKTVPIIYKDNKTPREGSLSPRPAVPTRGRARRTSWTILWLLVVNSGR